MTTNDPAKIHRTPTRAFLAVLASMLCGAVFATPTIATAAPDRLRADDPSRAPATTLSADGRSVTDGTRSLAVSRATGLVAGQSVSVSGSGFDVDKGIYVGLCVIPPTNRPPGPCAGGQDRSGSQGESLWISSNPPSYGAGLARPYGAGGTFSVTVHADPELAGQLDCWSVRCAIVTRNDHIRSSDRSQDLFIPVTFAPQGASNPPTTAPPSTIPVPTAPPTTPNPARLAPEARLGADGRSVTDGTRTLRASITESLDPQNQTIRISGSGFDPQVGVYVALCRIPETNQVPGPCTTPPRSALWLTPDPPPTAADFAQNIGSQGKFSDEIETFARIDATTDCREVACAITVRHDDTAAQDRRADLFLPVDFAAHTTPTTTTTTTVTATTTSSSVPPTAASAGGSGGSDGPPWGWIIAAVVAALTAGGAAFGGLHRYRHRTTGATP